LAKLGVANLIAGPSGDWILGGGLDPLLFQTGDRISIWKGDGPSALKVGETTVTVESTSLVLDTKVVKATPGEVYSFRVESAQTRVKSSVRESTKDGESTAPAKPSLKDRLKFD
jgi:hypothetical protein